MNALNTSCPYCKVEANKNCKRKDGSNMEIFHKERIWKFNKLRNTLNKIENAKD